MEHLSEEHREAIQHEVRKLVQQELMSEVHAHRSFLRSMFQWIISAITIVTVAAFVLFTYNFGDSVDDAKEDVIEQIDNKLIDYRIVEANRQKAEEFAKVAIENSKAKIEEELLHSLGEKVRDTLNAKQLEILQIELKKLEQSDLTQKISQSLSTIQNDVKLIRKNNTSQDASIDELRVAVSQISPVVLSVGDILYYLKEVDSEVAFTYSELLTEILSQLSGLEFDAKNKAELEAASREFDVKRENIRSKINRISTLIRGLRSGLP